MQATFPRWKLAAFALLSAGDFLITYLLISQRHDTVYEANPVANHWLQHGGWLGLAAFKAILVFFVMTIATWAYYRRPRMAHDLLALSCGAVVVAVLTGTTIAFSLSGAAPTDERSAQVRRSNPGLSSVPRKRDYAELLEVAARDVASQRIDLAGGVALLQECELANDAQWLAALRQAYPGIEERALLAADIVQHAVSLRLRTESGRLLACMLEKQYHDLYGVIPVLPYRQMLHLIPEVVECQSRSVAKAKP